MKVTLYTAVIIFSSVLASCGGSNKEDAVDKELMKAATEGKPAQNSDTLPVTQSVITQPAAPVVNGTPPVTTQPGTSGNNITIPATQPVTINTQPSAQTSAAGMNPAHGQPGHRCDIPVGSPLNSKPQPTNPAANISTTPAAAPTITPTAQATAPGMNPPHGQPGHRCDIPVGSPLNSKPPQATITPGTTTPKADTAKNR